MLGNAIASIALAFAVLDLTGSKSDLGFVLAARALPMVLFLLVGGIWADRLKRNQVMVASNVLSGASQALLAALLLTGTAQVWMLIVLAAANGVSSAFFFPASVGIVPQTVPATMLQTANALLRLGLNTTNIVGAAIGGLLVAATSPGAAIAVDAATYLLGALLIGLMSLPAGLRMEGSHSPRRARGGLARVLLAHLALGDRAPVRGHERPHGRRRVGARADDRQAVARRRRRLGTDPHVRVGRARCSEGCCSCGCARAGCSSSRPSA